MGRAKFVSTLNIALHPRTADAEILAAVRGAYRLLGGKTIDDFLEQTNRRHPRKPSLRRNYVRQSKNYKAQWSIVMN
jgi:hypothetical protein